MKTVNHTQKHLPLLDIDPEAWVNELLDHYNGTVLVYIPVENGTTGNNHSLSFTLAYGHNDQFVLNEESLQPLNAFHATLKEENSLSTFNQQLSEVYQQGKKSRHLYYHPATQAYLEITASKIKQGVLVFVYNKTADVQVQLEKEKQVELVNGILDATINGVFAMEALRNEDGSIYDFRFLKINAVFAAQLNLSENEIIGKSYLELLPHSMHNGLFALKCEVMEKGQTISRDVFYESNQKWLRISISRLGNNGIVETVMDITDSKKDKQEAEQTAQKLQTIISTSQSGVHIFRPEYNDKGEIIDFRMVMVNQTVAAYIGQTVDDLTGALASTYFPAYKSNGLFEIYRDVFLTNASKQFDFHYEDGYDVFFNLLVVKLGDELMVTLTDHTLPKRLQRELETSIAELKRSNASLEQFAHAASHDLQEPLRKIIVNSEKLLHEYGSEINDNAFGIVERIRTAGKRMHRLVQDLLVFAEVGANKNTFEDVELDALVHEVLNDLEVAITERDATIRITTLGRIKGDGLHLQQLFQNLISNSLKYSRHDVAPKIVISATTMTGQETGLPLSETELQQTYTVIELRDNGQGFTEEEATQIFKIFQRLPKHRQEYAGTGIGLAIVQRVVENHKGYITATGVEGSGATFKVFLPKAS